MEESTNKELPFVLIFNSSQILVAIMRSIACAAETGQTEQEVSDACTGKQASPRGYYYRYGNKDIPIDIEDLERLILEEYDKLCSDKSS